MKKRTVSPVKPVLVTHRSSADYAGFGNVVPIVVENQNLLKRIDSAMVVRL